MKPIRVALSGSGFKFSAHVGALCAIRDAGYTPVQLAGTSGGSIVATLAAAGMSLADMKALTMSRDWSDMLTFSPWSAMTRMGYCNGNTLLNWITEKTGGLLFSQMPVDLVVMASDVGAEVPFEFSRSATPDAPVALAARASAAIPFVYAPIQYGSALLMDGGCCNNIPIDKLTIDDVPRLGIQLVSKASPLNAGVHTAFDIAPRLVDLMLSANENTHVDLGKEQGAHFAFIETGFASGLDRNMPSSVRQQLFDNGYAGALSALDNIGDGAALQFG